MYKRQVHNIFVACDFIGSAATGERKCHPGIGRGEKIFIGNAVRTGNLYIGFGSAAVVPNCNIPLVSIGNICDQRFGAKENSAGSLRRQYIGGTVPYCF